MEMTGRRLFGEPSQIAVLAFCAVDMCSLFPMDSGAATVWGLAIILFSVFAFVSIHARVLGPPGGKDEPLLYKGAGRGAQVRLQTILDLVTENYHASASQVARILNVSSRTLERGLEWLKDKGVVVREGVRADEIWAGRRCLE